MKIFLIGIAICLEVLSIEAKRKFIDLDSNWSESVEEKSIDCHPRNCHYGTCVHGTCVCDEGWQGVDCGHCTGKIRLSKLSGLISTGIGNYRNNAKCSWLIEGRKPDSIIRLHIQEFDTEQDQDNLYIHDGDSVEAPLLATFSGSVRQNVEVTARSGNAFLSFYSNDHVRMSGFNITYKIDSCPSRLSSRECSGHGTCIDGSCNCDMLWKGEACDKEICPNYCFQNMSRGTCMERDLRTCLCNAGYGGEDCGQVDGYGSWEVLNLQKTSGKEIEPRTGHCAVVWGTQVYIIGGISSRKQNFVSVYDVNERKLTSPLSNPEEQPNPRYGHTCILSGDKIYMYGGKIINSTQTNEIWIYHITKSMPNWEKITIRGECSENSFCGPLEVSGHTANAIKSVNGDEKMLAFFGYSEQLSFLNTVQEYDLKTGEWRIVDTTGYPVKGTYGHTSVYDSDSNLVFIYGGYTLASPYHQEITNRLYSYHTINREWKTLRYAPSVRYLHSAVLMDKRWMIVLGGKFAKKTCTYCRKAMKYDVATDVWSKYDVPSDIEFSRYGHTATLYDNYMMFIYGGFDGQIIGDSIIHHFTTCWNKNRTECLSQRIERMCKWNVKQEICVGILDDSFPDDNYLTRTVISRSENKYCKLWLNGDCHLCYENCDLCGPISEDIKKKCEAEFQCDIFSCEACMYKKNCLWSTRPNKCLPLQEVSNIGNITESPKTIHQVCGDICAQHNSCGNCTAAECTWCQNEQRCVRTNGYDVNYAYSECRDSVGQQSKCLDIEMTTNDWCNAYKNCASCNSDPACGWCTNNLGSEKGNCLKGGAHQPFIGVCPIDKWYFGKCMQNGSTPDASNDEKCRPGYFGNPSNGETCELCTCYDQDWNCDSRTGKCVCPTMGVIGDHCEKCDTDGLYYGNPEDEISVYGTCIYNLTFNSELTFNISGEKNLHRSRMNFKIDLPDTAKDTDFYIRCSKDAKMHIIVGHRSVGRLYGTVFDCPRSGYRNRFFKTDFDLFWPDKDQQKTIFVYVYNLRPPMHLSINFYYHSKLNGML